MHQAAPIQPEEADSKVVIEYHEDDDEILPQQEETPSEDAQDLGSAWKSPCPVAAVQGLLDSQFNENENAGGRGRQANIQSTIHNVQRHDKDDLRHFLNESTPNSQAALFGMRNHLSKESLAPLS